MLRIREINFGDNMGAHRHPISSRFENNPALEILDIELIFHFFNSLVAQGFTIEAIILLKGIDNHGQVLEELLQSAGKAGNKNMEKYHFTPREREIALLTIKGYNQRDIADSLCITIRVVKFHRQHVYEKANVHGLKALVQLAELEKWMETGFSVIRNIKADT